MQCHVGRNFAVCAAGAMWDDPAAEGLVAYLNAVADQEWLEQERELDLQRQRELYPETEVEEPDVVPAELVLTWDAYRR